MNIVIDAFSARGDHRGRHVGQSVSALVAIGGKLELGDEDAFRTKTANLSGAIVALFP